MFFSLNFFVRAMAPFRIESAPQILQTMHDLGFSMTFSPVEPFTFQYLLIGLAILMDRSAQPVLPCWVAYVNLWVGVLFIPACFVPLLKSGPLAWNGVLSFWVPVAVFLVWYFVMFGAARGVLARSSGKDAGTPATHPSIMR